MSASWNASHAWDPASQQFGSFNVGHVWDAASARSVLDPPPTSLHEMRARHEALYERSIETGQFEVFVWPYWLLHFGLFLLYFVLVPPSWLDAEAARGSAWRRGRRWILLHAKYPLFLLFVWQTVAIVSTCRSPSGVVGYTIGLCNTFFTCWFAALFIFREPRFDCMRLEREKIPLHVSPASVHKAPNESSTTGAHGNGSSASGLRSRSGEATKPQRPGTDSTQESRGEYRYYWQGLPPTLGHRAAWILHLVTSLRGAGWAHQARTLPVPPPEALAQLPPSSPRLTAKAKWLGFKGPDSRARLLRRYLSTMAVAYVVLDLFQSFLVLHDPYYSGVVEAPFPPGLLPRVLSDSPIFVRSLRTLASGTALVFTLVWTCTGILTVRFLCTRHDELKGEPWLWTDVFGDPRAMLDHGLAGLWGESWHQAMRITFSAPGDAISAACGWHRRDPRAQAVTTMLAFVMSGFFHGVASYTEIAHTQPIKPFLFFALQGVGVLVETLVGTVCARWGLRPSERYMRVVRGAWSAAFFCLTAPLFTDDLARGGYWLTERLAFSVVRGLGLGPAPGARWSTWDGPLMTWHKGDVWWKSGFAA